jgi:hypothetical protein
VQVHHKPQRQQQQGQQLPLVPTSDYVRHAAMTAVADASAVLGQQQVSKLFAARQAAGQQLEVRGSGAAVVLPSTKVKPLVCMLCPALSTLLDLSRETAQHLHNLQFGSAPPQQRGPECHWSDTHGPWVSDLNCAVPDVQLLSAAGVKRTLVNPYRVW